MRRYRRLVPPLAAAAAFGLAGAGIAAVPSTAAPEPEDDVEITVLGTNDFHGRLEADRDNAGAAVLAGAVNELRVDNPNTVFAAAGDLIGASTFTSFVQDDDPTVEALNAAGLEVSAVGNHEFDRGYQDLLDRINGTGGRTQAEWEYLGANVKVKDGEDYDELAETWSVDFEGITVGFVGVVTEHLPSLVTPAGIAMLDVLDPTEEANSAAADLKAGGADVVVLLVHEGATTTAVESATDPDSVFGRIVTGVSADVDAIVSGHTHLAYNHLIEVPEWVADGRPVTERPVVSAGQYGMALNKIDFTVDPDDQTVQTVASEIVDLVDNESGQPNYPADDDVAKIVQAAVDAAEVVGAEPIGEITEDINRAVQSDGQENRGGESTLGNLVADVQLGAAQITDPDTRIAFMNPGGLRTDLEYAASGNEGDGVVTFREAAEVQPFANTLVTMTLTGEQVVSVLEEQWQPAGASRPFLKLGVAGLRYTYDPTADAGGRITDVTLADGSALDPTGEYRVVVNSFLASGGDNFDTLAEGTDPTDTGQIDLQAMVDFMQTSNEPVGPDRTQRAIGVAWQTEGPYAPGDEIAFDLSSLLFSDDEVADPAVEVSIDGTVLGSSAIDPTIVDTTDEVGRASISMTVPDDVAPGDAVLGVTIPATGTTASLPIVIQDSEPEPPMCHGQPATIVGTDGRDVLRGTPGADVIVGLGGDDVISGMGGDDIICGGAGNDAIIGGPGDDVISAGDGDDIVIGGAGDDDIDGGPGRNIVIG